MGAAIWAGGESVEINSKVIRWDEPGGFSFYKTGKFTSRDLTLEQLQNKITSLIFHHSVTFRAAHTYTGLAGRGLSCNFLVDDDGTIFQCLDIKDAGWSQKSHNQLGPGIEISSMPQAWSNPQTYNSAAQKKFSVGPREIISETIHGQKFQCFALNETQHQALEKLAFGFKVLFPEIPAKFPKNADGSFNKKLLTNPLEYRGLLNHYNIDSQKIDTMGLDQARIEKYVAEFYTEC